MISKLIWKLTPKDLRNTLLGRLKAVDRQSFEKLITGNTQTPQPFIDRQCLFIHIPKCAGSSIAQGLFGQRVTGHLPLWYFERTDPAFYANAFKFCFVRDPLDRAYSAYRYLLNTDVTQKGRDREIALVLRKYASFDDFVKRWLTAENIWLNVHFTPQSAFIANSQGAIDMDFIGRYEQIADDFRTIAEKLGINSELPATNISPPKKSIPDAQTLRKIMNIYAMDYDALDFNAPPNEARR